MTRFARVWSHGNSNTHRQPALLGSNWAKGKSKKAVAERVKNVVVFGETGVGKSSLINLIAGGEVAETSSSAVGCTLDYKRHLLKLDDQRFAIWDTAGLDEGTEGSVPAAKAEAYLRHLLRDLAKTRSIDLLVYCVRGTRVRSALLTNYHLFYSAICRKKVPIAIVVTGLENQEGNMDTWWLKNERQFSALGMRFDNYACVTTLQSPMENATLEERRRISRSALITMIMSTCRTEQWMPAERSWADTAFSDIRAILSPRDGHAAHIANLIMCDVSQNTPLGYGPIKRSVSFQNPVTLSFSLTRPMNFRSPVLVEDRKSQNKLPFNVAMKCTSERLLRVHQVSRKQTPSGAEEDAKQRIFIKRGADLLIFCADKDCRDVKSQWEYFNLTYGGDLSPQIVVVIGAADQHSAEEWWYNAVGGAVRMPSDTSIACLPLSGSFAETEAVKRRLRGLINTSCIDCSKANLTGDKWIFRRGTSPRLNNNLTSLWTRPPDGNGAADGPVVDQNILTEWGIWDDIERDSVIRRRTISRATASSWDIQDRVPFHP